MKKVKEDYIMTKQTFYLVIVGVIVSCVLNQSCAQPPPDEGSEGVITALEVRGYEIVRNMSTAMVGSNTKVQASCTDGKQVLGGGYHIITPVFPHYPGPSVVDPQLKILESGPITQEVLNVSTGSRYLNGLGWSASVYLQSYEPSPNHPDGPAVYVYAICAEVERDTE